jgi:hypothetical protein
VSAEALSFSEALREEAKDIGVSADTGPTQSRFCERARLIVTKVGAGEKG